MPEFTQPRSDAIRDGLIAHAAADLRPLAQAQSGATPHAAPRGHRPSRRSRVARWAAVTASVIIVAGVIGVGIVSAVNRGRVPLGDAVTPPAQSQTPSPTTTPDTTPEPTVASTTPPPDPADPSTWIVSQDGMGPFTIGMPFDEALAVVPGMTDGCGRAYFLLPDRLILARATLADDAPLMVVQWSRADGPRTAEGIGIGSTAHEVRTAYPDAEEVEIVHTYLQVGRVFFGLAGGVVDSIGVTSAGVPGEFCG